MAGNSGLVLTNGATADFRTGGLDTFANLGGATLATGTVMTGGVLNSGTYLSWRELPIRLDVGWN